MCSNVTVREGLELLLRKLSREKVIVEFKLQSLARRFGLSSWEELEELLNSRSIDSPEVDMLWTEYLYLRERLRKLRK